MDDQPKERRLAVVVTQPRSAGGTVAVDFSFLNQWLGRTRVRKVLLALRRQASKFASPTATYSCRTVLRHWCAVCTSKRLSTARTYAWPDDSAAAETLLHRLRKRFFQAEEKKGNALLTSNQQWGTFVRFLRRAHRVFGFPPVDDWVVVGSLPRRLVEGDRAAAAR